MFRSWVRRFGPERSLSKPGPGYKGPSNERERDMLILPALLLVILFFGLGFAVHAVWIVAVILFVAWLVGLALGRGETAGRHRFYRW